MKVLFRADSSLSIGAGHLMRCLALAESLRNRGADVHFAMAPLPGALFSTVETRGFRVIRLQQGSAAGSYLSMEALLAPHDKFDWIVVDHYALDASWESMARRHASRILVIDDIPDRRHDCDLLLVAHLLNSNDASFDPFISSSCHKLIGPRFALLRPEFRELRARALSRPHRKFERLFVSFGGMDFANESAKAVQAILKLSEPRLSADIVVGLNNPHQNELRELVVTSQSNIRLHIQPSNLGELMAEADLSVSAGGLSVFERFTLGLPTLAVSVADNQAPILEAYGLAGYLEYLGRSAEVSSDSLASALRRFIGGGAEAEQLSRRCAELVDGLGAERVAEFMSY